MNPIRQKYQLLFSSVLLSAYLLGNFGMVVFEAVHFLSHLGDGSNHHTLGQHEEEHNHNSLTLIVDLTNSDDFSETSIPANSKQKVKKFVQNSPIQIVFLTHILPLKNSIQLTDYQALKNQFSLQQLLPPPKFS